MVWVEVTLHAHMTLILLSMIPTSILARKFTLLRSIFIKEYQMSRILWNSNHVGSWTPISFIEIHSHFWHLTQRPVLAYLFTAESVRIVAIGDLIFFRSQTFTVRSSLPETTLSPTVKTAEVTVLEGEEYPESQLILLLFQTMLANFF